MRAHRVGAPTIAQGALAYRHRGVVADQTIALPLGHHVLGVVLHDADEWAGRCLCEFGLVLHEGKPQPLQHLEALAAIDEATGRDGVARPALLEDYAEAVRPL